MSSASLAWYVPSIACAKRSDAFLQPVRQEVGQWTKVPAPWAAEPETHIIQVSAGHMFSLYLTNTGQVWASGSSESGQLGNGKSGKS